MMSILDRWLLIAFIATFGTAATFAYSSARCFKRISRRSIDNYPPLAEYHMESLRACADYCVMAAGNVRRREHLCQSFTYDVPQKTCRLYDHDGMKVPAILHPAIGIDFYKRVGDEDGCKNSPPAENSLNFARFGSVSDEQERIYEKPHSPPQDESDTELLRDIEMPSDIMKNVGSEMKTIQKKSSKDLLSASSRSDEKELPATCLTSTGYYVVIGNEIVRPANNEGAVKVFNDVNQGDCAKFCSSNEGPNQEQLVCYSLNYFPMTKKCELYSILAEPHGPGSLVENQDVIYAEKFCLPSEKSGSCQEDEVFILHVQKSLTGIPTDQKPSQSITNCLQSCLNDDSCKTGVFDSTKQVCHLYKESVSKSQDSIVETPPGFVMIENGCAENRATISKQRGREAEKMPLEEETSSDWSDCDFRVNGRRVQVRTIESGKLETRAC